MAEAPSTLDRSVQQDSGMNDYTGSMEQYFEMIYKYAKKVQWYDANFDPEKKKLLENQIIGPLLNIPSKNLRTEIEGVMRCVPRAVRDSEGKIVLDENGKKKMEYLMKIHQVGHTDADILVHQFEPGYEPRWRERWDIADAWGLYLALEPSAVRKKPYPHINSGGLPGEARVVYPKNWYNTRILPDGEKPV